MCAVPVETIGLTSKEKMVVRTIEEKGRKEMADERKKRNEDGRKKQMEWLESVVTNLQISFFSSHSSSSIEIQSS